MKIERIDFGNQKPPEYDYRINNEGVAEVWLYKNIDVTVDEDGNESYSADGIFFKTMLDESEILDSKDSYFKSEEPETTISDLVEALDILTTIVLERE